MREYKSFGKWLKSLQRDQQHSPDQPSFFFKLPFVSVSPSVHAACVLVLLKPAPLCTQCPKQSAQTNTPACLLGTLILSLCVSQKTFHKSNKDSHWSNLQPEGPRHRQTSRVWAWRHAVRRCQMRKNHKSKNVARVTIFWEQRNLPIWALNMDKLIFITNPHNVFLVQLTCLWHKAAKSGLKRSMIYIPAKPGVRRCCWPHMKEMKRSHETGGLLTPCGPGCWCYARTQRCTHGNRTAPILCQQVTRWPICFAPLPSGMPG